MKNLLIITILLLTQQYSFGQSNSIKLIDKVDSIESFLPKKWRVLSTTNGDLNKDGLGRDTINLNPRILGIYFRNKKGKLIKKLQSNEFIIFQDSPTMDEPFVEVNYVDDWMEDANSPQAGMITTIKMLVSEYERKVINERCRLGEKIAMKSGRYIYSAPIGYKQNGKKPMFQNEKTPLIKELFEDYVTGLYSQIERVKNL